MSSFAPITNLRSYGHIYISSPGAFRLNPGREPERAWNDESTIADSEEDSQSSGPDESSVFLVEAELVVEPEPPLLVVGVPVPPRPIKRLVTGIRQLVPKALPLLKRRSSQQGHGPEEDPSSPPRSAESIQPGAYNVQPVLPVRDDAIQPETYNAPNFVLAEARPAPSESRVRRAMTQLQRLMRRRVRVEHQVGGVDQSVVQAEVRRVRGRVDELSRQEQSNQGIREEQSPTPGEPFQIHERSRSMIMRSRRKESYYYYSVQTELPELLYSFVTTEPSQAPSVDDKLLASSGKKPGMPASWDERFYDDACWKAWSDLAQAKDDLFCNPRRDRYPWLYGGVSRALFGREATSGLIDVDDHLHADLCVPVNMHLLDFSLTSDSYEPTQADSDLSVSSCHGPNAMHQDAHARSTLTVATESSDPSPSSSLGSNDIARIDRRLLEQHMLPLIEQIQALSHDIQNSQVELHRHKDPEANAVKIEQLESSLNQLSQQLHEAKSLIEATKESLEQKLASTYLLLEESTRRESSLKVQLWLTNEELASCKSALERHQLEVVHIQEDAKLKAQASEKSDRLYEVSLQEELDCACESLKQADAFKSKTLFEYEEKMEVSKRQNDEQLQQILAERLDEIGKLKNLCEEREKRRLDEMAISHSSQIEESACRLQARREQLTNANDRLYERSSQLSLNREANSRAQFCKNGIDQLRGFSSKPPERPNPGLSVVRSSLSMVLEGSSTESALSTLTSNNSELATDVGFERQSVEIFVRESELDTRNLEGAANIAVVSSEPENESSDSSDAESIKGEVGLAAPHGINTNLARRPRRTVLLANSSSTAFSSRVWSDEGRSFVRDACQVFRRLGVVADEHLDEIVCPEWSYRHPFRWGERTTLCHTWLFPHCPPANTFEMVAIQVFRTLIMHLTNLGASTDPTATAIGFSRFSVKQVICWQSSILIFTEADVVDTETKLKRKNEVELLVSLADDTLIISGKGYLGMAGEPVWKCGYDVCHKAIQRALLPYTTVKSLVACPECLLKVGSSKTSMISFETVKMLGSGSPVLCKQGHWVDSSLLCGTCLTSPMMAPPWSPCAPSGTRSVNSEIIKRGVVIVAVYDASSGEQLEVESGAIVDNSNGLIVTTAHGLWNHIHQSNGRVELDSRKVIRIGIHCGDDDAVKFCYTGRIVASDLRSVDACVLHITSDGSADSPSLSDLQQLKLATACYAPETVLFFGFNHGGEGIYEPSTYLDLQVDVLPASVTKIFKTAASSCRRKCFVPREEIVVVGGQTFGGQSGGPCVNESGEVVGILSRVDRFYGLRWYLTPYSELRPLVERAREEIAKVNK